MNLQGIKQHAELLLTLVANVEESERQLKAIETMEYYTVFGSEQERQVDTANAILLRDRCVGTLKAELEIGKLLIEG